MVVGEYQTIPILWLRINKQLWRKRLIFRVTSISVVFKVTSTSGNGRVEVTLENNTKNLTELN